MENQDEKLDKLKIFGRKVFFVNPSTKIERHVVNDLRDNEYEVYSINDFRYVKHVLQMFDDAVCFIYIDSGFSYSTWYKFIKSIECDDKYRNVIIGVLSERIPQAKKDFFLMNTNLPAGFINTNLPFKDIFNRINMVLEINETKGKRKYVRLQISNNDRISVFASFNGRAFSLEVLDISSVGLAVNVSAAAASAFAPKQILNSLSFTIDKKTFTIQCVVLMSKVSGKVCNSVLYFLNPPEKFIRVVKSFISSELEKDMAKLLERASLDHIDYASLDLDSLGTYGEISEEDEEVEEIEEIEEAEEVDEVDEIESAADGESE